MIREATTEETKGMMAAYLSYTQLRPEDVAQFSAYVRDQYISDGHGYTGRVGFFHWGGSPHLLSIFLRRDDRPKLLMGGWQLIAETNDLNLIVSES